MLVFQPELADVLPGLREKNEVVICLDCSSSMEGVTFTQARQLALYALSLLGEEQKVNILQFGTGECTVPRPCGSLPSHKYVLRRLVTAGAWPRLHS